MSQIAINATAVFKNHKTGVEWYSLRLIEHLMKIWGKDDPKVVLLVPEKLILGKEKKLIMPENWELKPIAGDFLWTQFFLWKWLKKNPPKVLFSPAYLPPFLKCDFKTVSICHGLEGEYTIDRTWMEKIKDRFFVYPRLLKNDLIIAVSKHTQKDLIRFLNVPEEKIRFVKSGPGTVLPAPPERRREENKKRDDRLIIVAFFGENKKRKNFSKTMRVFLEIEKRLKKPVKFYVSGLFREKQDLNFLKEKKNFIYKKYFNEQEKKEILKKAHFLFYLSSYEGFGFPILEAQNSGTIPVIFKQSGLSEIAGEGSLEFDPGFSSRRLAEKVLETFEKQKKMKKLREIGYENLGFFSWEDCAKEIKRILINFK